MRLERLFSLSSPDTGRLPIENTRADCFFPLQAQRSLISRPCSAVCATPWSLARPCGRASCAAAGCGVGEQGAYLGTQWSDFKRLPS